MKRRVNPGQGVQLISDPTQDDTDTYGRLLRYVQLRSSGLDLGEAQIRSGWAEAYIYESPFRRLRSYKRAEQVAASGGRGVFGKCFGVFHTTRNICHTVAQTVTELRYLSCGQARRIAEHARAALTTSPSAMGTQLGHGTGGV
jgi:Staphylococcal nuclease homologue